MKTGLRFAGVVVAVVLMASAVQGGEGLQGKSIGKALLLSLALPGTGQEYIGSHKRARSMWAAEGAIWTTYALFTVQGNNREDKYREMASLYAGIGGDRGDTYYQAIAFYTTNYEYNIDVRREARYIYPYDPASQDQYVLDNGYFGDDGWEWDSVERQLEYRDTRTASKESHRRATLTVGFAVLNRMVSMIDVYLTFKLSDETRLSSIPRLMVEQQDRDGFRVYLSTPF
ncbi:hypothetical protein ACFL2Z_01705 [Candidatus Eisenbacteria bacterium]|uniref:DUF5683 domain-containing protein n=1 Tax=Eiseniibacteriota bacterium TaxID=2212470 RepID=A0ABV6YNG4_UNCEI